MTVVILAGAFLWSEFKQSSTASRFERDLQAAYQVQFKAPGEGSDQARRLLRDAGTNAFPLLVEWLRWEPRESPALARAQTWKIFDHMPRIENLIFGTQKYRRACAAGWAFQLLGTNAAAAAPALRRLTNSTEQTEWRALDCLRFVTGKGD